MEVINRCRIWVESHKEYYFEALRIFLGIALMIRGIYFLYNTNILFELINDHTVGIGTLMIAHYVAFAHMAGGALLALGLLTRIAALVQVPALMGAIFLIHWREGLFSRGQNLELAVLVLVCLVVFTLYGSGPLSVDAYFKRHEKDVDMGYQGPRLVREHEHYGT